MTESERQGPAIHREAERDENIHRSMLSVKMFFIKTQKENNNPPFIQFATENAASAAAVSQHRCLGDLQ